MRRTFNEPVGAVRFVRMQQEPPPFIEDVRRRGRRAAGLRYESRVHEEFAARYPGYIPAMWFNYSDTQSDDKWCQTDGLIVDPWRGRIVIVEVKLQHTPAAYVQLFHLYLPVLRAVFGGIYELVCCEVVKWYDVATLTPVRPHLCPDPVRAKVGQFNVHIWRP